MLRGGDYCRGLLGFVAVVVRGNHLWTSGGALVIGRRSRAARATPRVRRPELPGRGPLSLRLLRPGLTAAEVEALYARESRELEGEHRVP